MDWAATATFVLALVTVGVVVYQNRWAERRERTNALRALAAEQRLNLAVLKEPSGYGRSAALRHSAFDRALPFIGGLSADLQAKINDAAVAMALVSRVLELSEGDAALGVGPEQRMSRSREFKDHTDKAVQALEAAVAALDRWCLGRP